MAAVAYDAAKSAARFAKAKGAFDEVIKVVYNAQADALEIEAHARAEWLMNMMRCSHQTQPCEVDRKAFQTRTLFRRRLSV